MRFRTWGVVVLLTAAAAGCAAVEEPESFSEQGASTEQVEESSGKKDGSAKPDAKPKWKKNMNKVELGMSMAKVKSLLGKPTDTTSSESELLGETTTLDLWTYGNLLEDETLWSLSFTDGKLDGKTRV